MDDDLDFGENLAQSKVRLVKMLDEFTKSESVTTDPWDAYLLTLLSSKTTKAEILAEYRSVLGPFVKLLDVVGSTEKMAEIFIRDMKKVHLGQYISVPMADDDFLVLKLRILENGKIVGFVQHKAMDKYADKWFFQFYAAILEGNGLYDVDVDHWNM